MESFAADGYEVARLLVQRGIALVYVIAFGNVLVEWRALLGEHGLLPVPAFTARTSWRTSPSLFHRRYDDRLATAAALLGLVVAAALVSGLLQRAPGWVTMAAFALLWVLYLSFVNVGQIFTAFGWESLLLEASTLAVFLGSGDLAPPWLVLIAVRWLLFRVEFGAGMIKMRSDPCWRNLTCTRYHHETQPLPGPFSARFHAMPGWMHRAEGAANHVVQLVTPFGLFLPQPVAGISASLIMVTQLWLMLSGNFAWLNLLTIVLAFSAIPDGWFDAVMISVQPATAQPTWFVLLTTLVCVFIAWRSIGPIMNLLSAQQRMNLSHDPLRLVNSYGAFGSVSRVRRELVIEATDATLVGGALPADARWEPYEFRAKPTDPMRRPPQVAPYHRRLDWLLWFAAMTPFPHEYRWFRALLDALLRADPRIRVLLRSSPFADQPPTAVRVTSMRYRLAPPDVRRATGQWWLRDDPRLVLGPVLGPVRDDGVG